MLSIISRAGFIKKSVLLIIQSEYQLILMAQKIYYISSSIKMRHKFQLIL